MERRHDPCVAMRHDGRYAKQFDPAAGMPAAKWGLRIEAAAIEPNHVHLQLAPLAHDIEDAVGRLKSQTSSALLKLPENWDRKRTWTAGYWKVFLFDLPTVPIVRRH